MRRSLSPVLKLAESCNLACGYCYQNGRLAPRQFMSRETLSLVLSQLADNARLPVHILWYGGEPTLVGREGFRWAVSRAEELLGRDGVQHSIQTNGLLVDEEWAELFAAHSVRVRLSLDGPEELHDQQRPTLNGRGSHRRVERALAVLKGAGLKVRLACTVTPAALPRAHDLVHYFSNLAVEEIDFSPALRFQSDIAEDWISGLDYGHFLVQVMQAWLALPQGKLRIRSLAGMIRRLAGQDSGYCKLEGHCSRYLTFGWDGSVYPCDEFSGLAGYCLGNVHYNQLAEILSHGATLPSPPGGECDHCQWTSMCPGYQCPFERLMNGSSQGKSLLCDGWRHLLEYLTTTLVESRP